MENALLVGLSRQVSLARELDVVANNVANVDTNGFKRRSTIFQEYVDKKASADTFPNADKRMSFVWDRGSALTYSQGAVEHTGNPLDVAIKGDAMFTVRTPAGERYTRNGAFEISAKGELITAGGQTVLTDGGPVSFTQSDTDIGIAPDGTVTTSQGTKGKLKLVLFDNPQSLRNEGGNLFSATTPPRTATPLQARIEQGALEKSNVQPVLEMTRLIEINRSYQNVANMMGRTDELRRTAISRLADLQS